MRNDSLIRAGEEAVRRYMKSKDQILPMARGLLAARRKFSADQAFGSWLRGSPYARLGQTDRAALIKIAEHEAIAAEFLKRTSLVSPELIWEAIADKMAVSDDRKPPTVATTARLRITDWVGQSDHIYQGRASTDRLE
jgi:hypothetical protein